MKYWKKLTQREQDERITKALKDNVDFSHETCLGIPASKLDPQVFYEQATFLRDSPLLRVYVQNPNHIGCHSFGHSEPFFQGTQEIEKEVIELLAVDMFHARTNGCDGYITSGGTEANIQAAWIYRNYFKNERGASQNEIALLCSKDTHYSVAKAANLLHLDLYEVVVDEKTRIISEADLEKNIKAASQNGVKYFIVFGNMGTTMFGSVDDPDIYCKALDKHALQYKIHADGAFGGFIYPVSDPDNNLNFSNPSISSITLDAHKMLQAPYGTGIFLVRKGLMQYTITDRASYVNGMDMTPLCGSRGGVNAVAIWMILFNYGPFGWMEKINKLIYRTKWLGKKLDEKGVRYYRHPKMNIVTIDASCLGSAIAEKFKLVPDRHEGKPAWYKIVLMDHVSIDNLEEFINDL